MRTQTNQTTASSERLRLTWESVRGNGTANQCMRTQMARVTSSSQTWNRQRVKKRERRLSRYSGGGPRALQACRFPTVARRTQGVPNIGCFGSLFGSCGCSIPLKTRSQGTMCCICRCAALRTETRYRGRLRQLPLCADSTWGLLPNPSKGRYHVVASCCDHFLTRGGGPSVGVVATRERLWDFPFTTFLMSMWRACCLHRCDAFSSPGDAVCQCVRLCVL